MPRELRKGMWVVHQGRVAILVDLSGDKAGLHYVAADGTTEAEAKGVPAATLRQAALGDIPAPRRPTQTAGAVLGYV